MSWPAGALPAHCDPSNDFLLQFSRIFHVCIPTPLAFVSNALGALSILAWLFAQLPQVYKNWRISSTSGLSIFFLVEWLLGDVSNLLGALFTHQAPWQVGIGAYYVLVDLCLVCQWIWYERLRHGNPVWRIRWRKANGSSDGWSDDGGVVEGVHPPNDGGDTAPANAKKPGSRPMIIFRTPTFTKPNDEGREKDSLSPTPGRRTIYRVGPSSLPSPSPRTVLFIACLIALAQASPITPLAEADIQVHSSTSPEASPLERIGTLLSWISTVLYLGSRLPQLFKNWKRKSTAGLSPHLFAAAFAGNSFYSAALATNPSAWSDLPPFGGRGWAGPHGSQRAPWIAAALPFFLGAAGVLALDASVGLQFLMYGESGSRVVVAVEEGPTKDPGARRSRWRRVSGWMRGWVPSASASAPAEAMQAERQALLRPEGGDGGPQDAAQGPGRYGAA